MRHINRRGFLTGLLCVALSPAAQAAITLLSHAGVAATAATPSVTIDSTGATLLVACGSAYGGNGSGKTVTDLVGGNSNTWTRANYVNVPSDAQVELWYSLPTHLGASDVVTYSASSSGAGLFVAAYSGTVTSSVTDGASTGTASGGPSTIQPGSITASQAGDLYVTCSAASYFGSTAPTINSSFTVENQRVDGGGYGGGLADFIQGSPAALNPTWTFAGGLPDANMQAFKAAGGGGGPAPTLIMHGSTP